MNDEVQYIRHHGGCPASGMSHRSARRLPDDRSVHRRRFHLSVALRRLSSLLACTFACHKSRSAPGAVEWRVQYEDAGTCPHARSPLSRDVGRCQEQGRHRHRKFVFHPKIRAGLMRRRGGAEVGARELAFGAQTQKRGNSPQSSSRCKLQAAGFVRLLDVETRFC